MGSGLWLEPGILKISCSILLVCVLALLLGSTAVFAFGDESLSQDDLYGKIIKDIRINGANNTKHFVIKRELKSKVGQPYLEENAKEDYNRLDRLGVFSDIKIYGAEEAGEIILNVEVRETFRFLPVVSLSISDENGVLIGGGLKSANLLGRAVYFSGVARFGGATTIEVILRDPWLMGNHMGYEVKYYHTDRRNEIYEFDEIAEEVSLTLRSHIRNRGRMGFNVWFQSMKSSEDGKTLSPTNRDNVATVGIFLGYDSRDLASNASTGWKTEIDVAKSGVFDTDSDFWRTNIDLSRYFSLSEKHTIALSSLTTLTTGTVDEEIASWQQFGLGGTNSVRGWDLGSRIGKNQFINTAEYRYLLLRPRAFSYFGVTASLGLQLTVFGDFGWGWEDREEFSDSFIDGYGLGLRLLLPYVGVVRLDFGVGQPSGGVKFHLGSYEKAVRQRDRVR